MAIAFNVFMAVVSIVSGGAETDSEVKMKIQNGSCKSMIFTNFSKLLQSLAWIFIMNFVLAWGLGTPPDLYLSLIRNIYRKPTLKAIMMINKTQLMKGRPWQFPTQFTPCNSALSKQASKQYLQPELYGFSATENG